MTQERREHSRPAGQDGADATGRVICHVQLLTCPGVRLSGITVDRLEDDKIVKAWRSMDTLHLFWEIGTIPPHTP